MAMQQQPPMRAAPPKVSSWGNQPTPAPARSTQPAPMAPPAMSAQPAPAPAPSFREGKPIPPGIYPSPGRTMPGQPPGPGGPNGQVAMPPRYTTGQEVFQPGGKFYDPNPPQFNVPRPAPLPVTGPRPSMPPQWGGGPLPTNDFRMGRGFPGGPPIGAPGQFRPPPQWGQRPPMRGNPLAPGGGYGPSERRPGAPPQWGGGYRPPPRQLNDQQMMMKNMPPGMRQAYNNRPMTAQPQGMRPMAPPTQRGRPAASRVNLQGNQLSRFRQ